MALAGYRGVLPDRVVRPEHAEARIVLGNRAFNLQLAGVRARYVAFDYGLGGVAHLGFTENGYAWFIPVNASFTRSRHWSFGNERAYRKAISSPVEKPPRQPPVTIASCGPYT